LTDDVDHTLAFNILMISQNKTIKRDRRRLEGCHEKNFYNVLSIFYV